MKKKLREVVDNLEHEDLIKLQEDINEEEGMHIKKLISDKIKQLEDSEKAVCAVCGNRALHFDIWSKGFQEKSKFLCS